MTLDEAFACERRQPFDRDAAERQVRAFHGSEHVMVLVNAAIEQIADNLENDPEERLSISELISEALVMVIMAAYNAGFAAGREVGVEKSPVR
jgi:hypothetical protein